MVTTSPSTGFFGANSPAALTPPSSRAFTLPPPPRPAVADLVDAVSPLIHSGDHNKAAGLVNDWLRDVGGLEAALPNRSVADATVILQILLHDVLQRDYLAQAAQLLWQPSLFTPEPRSVRMIWDALQNHQSVLLQGASSMGKTYVPGVYFFLKWLQDPTYTNVITVGPTKEHLEANLFTHLIKLHTESALALPGTPGQLFIGESRRNMRAAIRGIVIPIGKGASGRIQGTKRHARSVAHPRFGKLSRVFIVLDELENIPEGVFADLVNVMSISGEEPDGFRLVGAYNPKDVAKIPYTYAEPPDGWKSFDIDTDEVWTSKRGWRVCRLDALKSENVVEDRVIYSGLQTADGVRKTMEASGGVDGPNYATFARGAYPTKGITSALIDLPSVEAVVAKVRFHGATHRLAGIDLALEGGDNIEFALGTYGLASGFEDSHGFHPFIHSGKPVLRPALFLEGIYDVPKGPAPAVADSIKAMCTAFRVPADGICVDRTGNGAGVHDILKATRGYESTNGVNFFQAASKMKILDEDEGPAEETCHRMDSELAISAREWILYKYAWINPDYSHNELAAQLSGRKTYTDRKKRRVESKKDYKARNQDHSPNKSDAFCLCIHQARVKFAPLIQSVITTAGVRAAVGHDPKPLVDPTNALEDLFEGDLF